MPSSGKGRSDSIGARIRVARKSAGLTQWQLAGREFTRGFISQIENGVVQPSLPSLRIIAARLGMNVEWFMQDEQPLADVPPPGPPQRKWAIDTLDNDERKIIKLYRGFDREGQHLVLKFIQWVNLRSQVQSQTDFEEVVSCPGGMTKA